MVKLFFCGVSLSTNSGMWSAAEKKERLLLLGYVWG
jgi:hypothetical protein